MPLKRKKKKVPVHTHTHHNATNDIPIDAESTASRTGSPTSAPRFELKVINACLSAHTIQLPQTPTAALLAPFYALHELQQPNTSCGGVSSPAEPPKSRESVFSVAPKRGRKAKRKGHKYMNSVHLALDDSTNTMNTNRVLTKNEWLQSVPHVVFGRHSALPSATQLPHFCVSRCQAKLIYVQTAALHYALRREATPLPPSAGGETPATSKFSAPYYLLINYGDNDVYVNHTAIPRLRSVVLCENDIVSFLENPFSGDGGVLDAVAPANNNNNNNNNNINESENSNLSTLSSTNSTSSLTHILPNTQQHAESFASIQNTSLQSFLSHYIRQSLRDMVKAVAQPKQQHHKKSHPTSNVLPHPHPQDARWHTKEEDADMTTATATTTAAHTMNTIYGTHQNDEGGDGEHHDPHFPIAVLRPPTIDETVVHYLEWKRMTRQEDQPNNNNNGDNNNNNHNRDSTSSFFFAGDELVVGEEEEEHDADSKDKNMNTRKRRRTGEKRNEQSTKMAKKEEEEEEEEEVKVSRQQNKRKSHMRELQKYRTYFSEDYLETIGTVYSPLQSYLTLHAAAARQELESYYAPLLNTAVSADGSPLGRQSDGHSPLLKAPPPPHAASSATAATRQKDPEEDEEDVAQVQNSSSNSSISVHAMTFPSSAEQESPFKSILAELQSMQRARESDGQQQEEDDDEEQHRETVNRL